MFMGLVESTEPKLVCYPEIEGKRVLVAGITPERGADLAITFAEQGARMVLAFDGEGEEVTALIELAARSAPALAVYTDPIDCSSAAVRLARSAVQAYGGLDVVITLTDLAPPTMPPVQSLEEVEQRVASRLALPALVGRIAANRMQLTETEGLVLAIATCTGGRDQATATLAGMARNALTAMTRSEARRWAPSGIRVNAVAAEPESVGEAGASTRVTDRDLTALSLYLASGRGKALTGHVLDARAGARLAI
jgi:NAD(P)-dependent dehydrogenase (short-subunit alcohol dehydrogenase family)